jgi:replicative DNA helicase
MATVPTQHAYTDDLPPDPADGFERTPPQDIDAEQSVLGGMLLSKDAIGDVVDALDPLGGQAFYRPAHETIYGAILDLYARGESADPITVAHELRTRGELERVGGAAYLHWLVSSVPTAANADHYAEIVLDRAKLRRLAEAGTRITQMGYAAQGEADGVLDAAAAEIAQITQTTGDRGGAGLAEVFQQAMTKVEEIQQRGEAVGVLTGYTDLDSLTHGLHPGQMIIIAGRPGMGKSTAAVDVARHAAIRGGHSVVLFSLEMSREEIGMRIASAEAKVGLHHLRGGAMTDDDWQRIARVSPAITSARLHIDDTPGLTLTQIKAACRRIQQRQGLDLVVIDYLQLVTHSGRRAENRQVEVSQMSKDVKLMAKELGVPVVALSQLNRGPEARTDKRPMMSDLRESGSLEQDSDVVILLHREDAYEKDSPRAGEVDLIVAKHRNGPTASITVAAQLHYSRFVNMGRA